MAEYHYEAADTYSITVITKRGAGGGYIADWYLLEKESGKPVAEGLGMLMGKEEEARDSARTLAIAKAMSHFISSV